MDEEENDEIAAAMGFASFGGTKRKYDHTNSPKAKAAADASGANSTKLGVRMKTMGSAEETKVADAPANSINQMSHALSSAQLGNAPKPAGGSGMAEFLVRPQSSNLQG
jgi:hypothetical protein